jgi:exosortase
VSEVSASDRAGGAAVTALRRSDRVLLLAIATGTLLLSVPAFWNVSIRWRVYEQFGHAYLMAAVAGWFVYAKRAEVIRALRRLDPPRYGALLVFAAALFEVLAFIGDLGFPAGVGVPLLIGSVAFAVGGSALVRPLTLPLIFLALMIPPGFLMNPLLVRLKLLVTGLAVSLLQRLGDPVLAEGNRILVPGHELFVADACSGMTSIVTMLPIACLVSLTLLQSWWRRAVVVLSVIPVAIAANVIRVMITVKLVPTVGVEAAQGVLHESFGVAAFAVGTMAVIGLARWMR